MQITAVIDCWFEMERLVGIREKGFRRIGDVVNALIGGLIFVMILAIGIFAGWVRIPLYLGDGYSYDNF